MKKFAALALFLPAYLSATYSYYAADNLQTASHAAALFYENGTSTNSSAGLNASTAGGGAYIANAGPPDGTHQYEVAATVNIAASGGNYVLFLEASSNALMGSSAATGSFYAISMGQVTVSSIGCTAQAYLYKVVSGSVTSEQSATVPCGTGLTYHAVWGNDNRIRFWVNNFEYLNWKDSGTVLVGTAGIGGYNMPSGNSISLVELGPCDRVAPSAVDVNSSKPICTQEKWISNRQARRMTLTASVSACILYIVTAA